MLPADKPFQCADPKTAVAGDEERSNKVVGEALALRGLPGGYLDSIEAKQAGLRAQPQIRNLLRAQSIDSRGAPLTLL
jgi:hypothetical protein